MDIFGHHNNELIRNNDVDDIVSTLKDNSVDNNSNIKATPALIEETADKDEYKNDPRENDELVPMVSNWENQPTLNNENIRNSRENTDTHNNENKPSNSNGYYYKETRESNTFTFNRPTETELTSQSRAKENSRAIRETRLTNTEYVSNKRAPSTYDENGHRYDRSRDGYMRSSLDGGSRYNSRDRHHGDNHYDVEVRKRSLDRSQDSMMNSYQNTDNFTIKSNTYRRENNELGSVDRIQGEVNETSQYVKLISRDPSHHHHHHHQSQSHLIQPDHETEHRHLGHHHHHYHHSDEFGHGHHQHSDEFGHGHNRHSDELGHGSHHHHHLHPTLTDSNSHIQIQEEIVETEHSAVHSGSHVRNLSKTYQNLREKEIARAIDQEDMAHEGHHSRVYDDHDKSSERPVMVRGNPDSRSKSRNVNITSENKRISTANKNASKGSTPKKISRVQHKAGTTTMTTTTVISENLRRSTSKTRNKSTNRNSAKKGTTSAKKKPINFRGTIDEKVAQMMVEYVEIGKKVESAKQELALRPDYNIKDHFRCIDK